MTEDLQQALQEKEANWRAFSSNGVAKTPLPHNSNI